MKNLITIAIVLMLAAGCWAADTYSFFSTGTVTAAATTVIPILGRTNVPQVANTIVVFNDSSTVDAYVDLSGSLTNEAMITAESKAITLKAGEILAIDFRTNRIKIRGKTYSLPYRVWAAFQ